MDDEQDQNERQRTDGIDDGEHANAPFPRGDIQNSGGKVATDPSIDLGVNLSERRKIVQLGAHAQ